MRLVRSLFLDYGSGIGPPAAPARGLGLFWSVALLLSQTCVSGHLSIVFVKFCKLKKSNIFSFSPLLICSSTDLLTVGVPPPTS